MRIRGPGGLWRHPDFLLLWGAQSISQLGTQITLLALPLTAILVLDASAFAVASLSAAEWTPWLLFSLPAGAWIDRLRRRPVLVVADVGRAAALASIPAAYAAGALTLGHLYVVAFIVGTLTVFFDVADRAYLPSLVEREQLGEANAKLEVTRSAAQFGGPGIGGGLVELLTAPVAILADAVSFGISALLLGRIRRAEEVVQPEGRGRLWAEIREGVRFTLQHPFMRPGVAFTAVSNFFYLVGFSILVVYAVRELGMSSALIGLVLSLGTVGGLAGAVVASRIRARLGIGPTMIAAAFTLGWPLLFLPLAPADYAAPMFIAALALVTFAGVVYNVVAVTLFQAITPDRLLGRTTASRRLVVFGAVPLGSLAGGGLASTIGLRETLWVSAIGATVAFVPLLSPSVRTLRELPEPA